MENHQTQLQEAATFVREQIQWSHPFPKIALVLGTGLGSLIYNLEDTCTLDYESIPFFPHSTVPSHRGRLVWGLLNQVPVLLMDGRMHRYEGWTPLELAFPIRLLHLLGIESIVLTNAAGGLNQHFEATDIMLVKDHLNLMGFNPLIGPNIDSLGERFPDMSQVYHPGMQRLAQACALDLKIPLRQGVYVGVMGPSMETPAETRMLRILGADAVGMSTIPEVITAVHCGLQIMVISAITNINQPDCMQPAPLDEVIAHAEIAAQKLGPLLALFVKKWHAQTQEKNHEIQR